MSKGQELCKLDPGTRMATLSDARARLAEALARVPEARAHQEEAQARLDEAKINNNAALKLSQGGYATETRGGHDTSGVSEPGKPPFRRQSPVWKARAPAFSQQKQASPPSNAKLNSLPSQPLSTACWRQTLPSLAA